MHVLEMKNITKRFIGVTALDDVSIDVDEGEIMAICGENGAGKSTLMKILSGSYVSGEYEGEILLSGEKVHFNSTRDAETHGIGMIYQEISLHLDLSIAENLFLGNLPLNRIGFIDWKKIYRMSAEALEMVGLEIDPKQKAKTLSTSKQQLVTIAKALLRKPKVLVLDEPTSALTESETKNLFGIIMSLKKSKVSCLYISHKLSEVFEIADRVIVLRDGKFISCRKIHETTTEKMVEDMVGRKIENMYPKEDVEQGEEVLRVENLCVPHPYIKDSNIVDGVSFSLRKGEILALAGLVGAGRSELLNALFKVDTEGVTGEVWLENKKLTARTPSDMKNAGVGYLTEDRKVSGFIAGAAIRSNITLASLRKITEKGFLRLKKEKRIAREYAEKLTVKAPSVETRVVNLSGGNQQKVILAKWLLTDLKVLLLDEPTRGIDVGAKAEIYRLINELSKNGIGIIMVSSEMPELIAMGDRFLVLSGGKIRAEYTKSEVNQEKIMKAAAVSGN